MNAATFRDFLGFGRALVSTKDIDPVYPLLKYVIQREKLDAARAHWLVFLYLTFYNSATAWTVFQALPTQQHAEVANLERWEAHRRPDLKINMERRGLRGGRWVQVLGQCFKTFNGASVLDWLKEGDDGDVSTATARYERLWERMPTLPYIGRWASFKWLDLLQHVLDWPLSAPDMRMAYCSGPRQALEEVYLGARSDRQDAPYITYLDQLGVQLRTQLCAAGLDLAWDELETALCNFHSVMHGRYYVGHDIDEHQHDLEVGLGTSEPSAIWWQARGAIIERSLLGEYNGWSGVRADLRSLYKRTGRVHLGGAA